MAPLQLSQFSPVKSQGPAADVTEAPSSEAENLQKQTDEAWVSVAPIKAVAKGSRVGTVHRHRANGVFAGLVHRPRARGAWSSGQGDADARELDPGGVWLLPNSLHGRWRLDSTRTPASGTSNPPLPRTPSTLVEVTKMF